MKKSTLLTIVALVLALAMGISGTMAYLTDTDSDVNVMVLGSIKIDQHEQDRNGNDFDQYQTLLPIVGGTSEKDNNGYPANGNYIDKIVTVENTGKNDAYVRTFIAIPVYRYEGQDVENASANVIHWNGYSKGDETDYDAAGKVPGKEGTVANNWSWGKDAAGKVWPGNGGIWNSFNAVIDGMNYEVFVVTNTEAVKPGEITAPNMIGIYLDSKVDYDHDAGKYTYDGKEISNFDGTVKVLVASQAVQFDSGWKDAFDALNTAFGAPAADNHPWTGAKAEPTNPSSTSLVTNEAELAAALEKGTPIIKLGGNIVFDDVMTLKGDTVIDLNGYDLDASANESRPFELTDDATLTINAGENEIKMGKFGLVKIPEGVSANVTINGGNITGQLENGSFIKIDSNEEVSIELNDVTYVDNSPSQDGWLINSQAENLSVTINGGDYTAPYGFQTASDFEANNAAFTSTANDGYVMAHYETDAEFNNCTLKTKFRGVAPGYMGTITLNNSSVYAENEHALYAFTSGGTIYVNDSEIEGHGSNGDYYFNKPTYAGAVSKIVINGVTVYEKAK